MVLGVVDLTQDPDFVWVTPTNSRRAIEIASLMHLHPNLNASDL